VTKYLTQTIYGGKIDFAHDFTMVRRGIPEQLTSWQTGNSRTLI
jgi:hypothetical protein